MFICDHAVIALDQRIVIQLKAPFKQKAGIRRVAHTARLKRATLQMLQAA